MTKSALRWTVCACSIALAGAASAQNGIPDFSSNGVGWQTGNGGEYAAVPGSPTPVRNDPAHPFVPNGSGKQPTYRIGDLSNPNLKQWAKEVMKKDNDEVLAGKIAYTPYSSCHPSGVPAIDLQGGPFFFVQTPKEVLMLLQQDNQIRHIYLDVPHSNNVKPSWYGESVGHYDGDTLVVDTIGLAPKSFVDNYRTPHTTQLHVVERFRLVSGTAMEVRVRVEDPGAFTMPWNAVQRYRVDHRPGEVPLHEMVCAENNTDHFNQGLVPIPQSDRPDF